MQPQPAPLPRFPRFDRRSAVAAALCILALFSDGLGWLFAVVGIFLLRRATFSRSVKWLLAGIAIAPKILFIGVRSLTAPQGLSFPIEPSNLATSPSLWASTGLFAAVGVFLAIARPRTRQAPDAPVQPAGSRSWLISALGLALVAIAAFLLLGLNDGFHRIDDAGQGRWALRHAARGVVATFAPSQLAGIQGAEIRAGRSGSKYTVDVALADGRSFSASSSSSAMLDELRKFAATANLPGKVRIQRRNRAVWISGTSGIGVNDCVGTYESVDERAGSRGTYEFWLDSGRLAGKETVADASGRHVRVLRNAKLSDTGDLEYEPAAYVEASQNKQEGSASLSFSWLSTGEKGRFATNVFEVGTRKYQKR